MATCVLVLNCVHSSGRRMSVSKLFFHGRSSKADLVPGRRLLVQEKGGTAILHAMLEQLDTLLEDRESRAFEIMSVASASLWGLN